jgi:hypothetical protein
MLQPLAQALIGTQWIIILENLAFNGSDMKTSHFGEYQEQLSGNRGGFNGSTQH